MWCILYIVTLTCVIGIIILIVHYVDRSGMSLLQKSSEENARICEIPREDRESVTSKLKE